MVMTKKQLAEKRAMNREHRAASDKKKQAQGLIRKSVWIPEHEVDLFKEFVNSLNVAHEAQRYLEEG